MKMTSEPIILFRGGRELEEEKVSAKKYFNVIANRSQCKNQLVIPRYSALPYYRELEEDLNYNGCKLINSYEQHRWIANFDYYRDLKSYTPETWSSDEWPTSLYEGPVVLKGKTNSLKGRWNTHMYARDREVAHRVACNLLADSMIGEQDVIYRKYVPLKTFEYGIGGMPFSNEWRFFYLGTRLLSYGYYWSIADDLVSPKITQEGIDLANAVAKIAAKNVNFFVVDVAETAAGNWIMIELNDGSMSGLSENNPDTFYENLSKAVMTSVRTA
jgi:hypothetical protein